MADRKAGRFDEIDDCDVAYVVGGDTNSLSAEGQVEARNIEQGMNLDGGGGVGDGVDGDAQGEDEDEAEDDDGADDDNSTVTNLEAIAETKSMFCVYTKVLKKGRANQSPIWDYFYCFKRIDNLDDEALRNRDEAALNKLLVHEQLEQDQSRKKGPVFYICKTCFEDKKTAMHNCFVKGAIGTNGNLSKHLEKKHLTLYYEYAAKRGLKVTISPSKRSAVAAASAHSSDSTGHLASKKVKMSPTSGVPSVVSAAPHNDSNFTSPTASSLNTYEKVSVDDSSVTLPSCLDDSINTVFTSDPQLGREDLAVMFKELQHAFTTNNNIPTRATTDHSNCPEFKNLCDFLIKHGKQLLGARHLVMGPEQFNRYRRKKFNTLTSGTATIVSETRDFWERLLKKRTGYIDVGHDIWDSNNKEALGVTAFFYSPVRQGYFRIPIGLSPVADKKSEGTALQTLELLALSGIEEKDLYKAVNDTTNTALKVGRLLTGENGGCAMHEVQLLLEHAMGTRKRSANTIVTDSFPEAQAIRKKALAASGWLMERKAKGRFKTFETLLKEQGLNVKRIQQPNSTRAAGTQIHFESILVQRFTLPVLWARELGAKSLSNEDFFLVAQFAAVLHAMAVLLKVVQTDLPGSMAYTYYLLFRTWVTYMTNDQWWVAETRSSEVVDVTDKWDGNARWPKRNYFGQPIEKIVKGTMINVVPISRNKLDERAKTLIDRLCKEFLNYGAKPTKNRLLACACHPFMATHGMMELEIMSTILEETTDLSDEMNDLIRSFDFNFKEQAIQALIEEIKDVCSEIIPAGGNQESTSAESKPLTKKEEVRLRLLQKSRKQVHTDLVDPVERQVKEFFNQSFDPLTFLQPELRKAVGDSVEDWMQNIEVIMAHLNVFAWWELTGKSMFPWIYPVACRILSLPESNGSQERTFSAATWMDGNLNRRQNDMTFQMKVLLYKNNDLMKVQEKFATEERMKEAEKRTKDLLKKSMGYLKKEAQEKAEEAKKAGLGEEDIDEEDISAGVEELEDMLDAYEEE